MDPLPASVSPTGLRRLLGEAWRRPRAHSDGLADALRALMVEGRLAARTRLPSERALAPALGVSRGTVSRAYARLRADGYVAGHRGAGSWLTLPGDGPPSRHEALAEHPGVLDLTVAALPAPEPELSSAAHRAAARLARHTPQRGYVAAGLPELRSAVAARFTERGVPTAADEILITAGAQHALHLLLALLATPGDRVVVDAPAYPRSLAAIGAARARAVAVPLTATGWDADAWGQTIALSQPRLALTVPDYHNPTGLTMSAADRSALTGLCHRAGVILIADETMSELRVDGPPLPAPLAAAGPPGAVVTVGSLSKSAWGGLRLGWIRARPSLVRELAATRAIVDMASPVLDQLLALELLAELDSILAGRRRMLRGRRDVLVRELSDHAPAWTYRRPRGGMCAWIRLPAPVAVRLTAAAARDGVRITPGPAFAVDGTFEHHFRLPFAAAPDTLADAVARLARLAGTLAPGTAPSDEEAADPAPAAL
jgi:DNA-binding transcriptional MocR family regulator